MNRQTVLRPAISRLRVKQRKGFPTRHSFPRSTRILAYRVSKAFPRGGCISLVPAHSGRNSPVSNMLNPVQSLATP
jgi:hypothetical protein